jgi:heptosyltransferase-2
MKILIVGPAWVGDMVMAQSLFMCLKQQHPDAVIDVLAPAWSEPLLSRMPEVHRALPLDIAHGELGLGKRLAIGRELRAAGYDQAIVLPNSFKSALIPCFAHIPLRTGWRGEARGWLLNDSRKLDKEKYPLMVQRFVALAYRAPPSWLLAGNVPVPRLRVDASVQQTVLAKFGLDTDKPVLVLCPGAEYGPSKQWPEAHYAAVAAHYLQPQCGYQVWMLGSARDRAVAERVLSDLPASTRANCRNLCGETTLGEAIDILAAATMVVSNDSGLMHVAAAVGRPLVVVYGSTSPAFTPPLSARARTVSLQLDCSPCFKRECPLGHLNCLKQLAPSMAIGAIAEVFTELSEADATQASPAGTPK